MKRFVLPPVLPQAVIVGLGGVLLVGVIGAETVVSHLLVAGLVALSIRGERIRRRREKDEATRQV